MKYLVWLIVLFYSCEEKVINEPLNQIEIDLSQSNPINLDMFCSKIELIPLESSKESLFSEPGRIILHNNHFYIRDLVQHILYKFDVNGRFCLSTKNMKGEGPGKYLSLIDFDLLADNNHRLALLDGPGYKIHFIDTGFIYQSFANLSDALLPIGNFVYKGDSTFIFHRYNKSEGCSSLSYLQFGSGNINDHFVPESNGHELFSSIGSHFIRFNNQLYFDFKNGSNDIFLINPDNQGLTHYLNIDFGKFNIDPAKIEYGASRKESVEKNIEKFAALYNFQETNDYWVSHFRFNDSFYVSIVDKISNKSGVYIMLPGVKGQLMPPFMVENNVLYTIGEAMYLDYFVSENLLTEDSRRILPNIKLEDNYVIIKYTLQLKQ